MSALMTPSPTRAAMGRTHRRAVIVGTASAALLVAVSLVTMTVGDYPLSLAETIQTLFGGGSQRDQYIIFEVRLPRLLMAVLCGVGLGASGAIMQALLRNPLASPELLGITGGASVAAVAGTLMFGLGGLALVGLAFAGGLVIAAVLLVAAAREGSSSYRIVLAGVGIAFVCVSVVGYLMKRAQLNEAQMALRWITGSIDATAWRDVLVLGAVLLLALPLAAIAGASLQPLELGDAQAGALGVSVQRSRTGLLIVAVLMAATVTAFVGPIAFVALSAPAIARGLVGRASTAITASALLGGALLAVSDIVAQHALGRAVPVGVVTGMVGALYLLWLLARAKGRRT
ncbi:FecCD family ABC transporter permease [Agrococcus casei]|uniref:FecCD family ABC transporter permease n=2 Tax=Agrococcus casei TaxID=343512 RepID=UPI003F90F868